MDRISPALPGYGGPTSPKLTFSGDLESSLKESEGPRERTTEPEAYESTAKMYVRQTPFYDCSSIFRATVSLNVSRRI
ncbi:hypothetical protein Nepgr_005641 [Nepenthes gracilis]|uniref:Uncharacterized protein n=1 Tax=Nepenthes gracilis TaxID=150966 RepID=A0AAD3S3I9_NEPGR|nr:hypothetical protein Nepgr_005641 [Nepenthes gracilis]